MVSLFFRGSLQEKNCYKTVIRIEITKLGVPKSAFSHLYLCRVWVFYFLTYLDNVDQVLTSIVEPCRQVVSLGHSTTMQWKESSLAGKTD